MSLFSYFPYDFLCSLLQLHVTTSVRDGLSNISRDQCFAKNMAKTVITVKRLKYVIVKCYFSQLTRVHVFQMILIRGVVSSQRIASRR